MSKKPKVVVGFRVTQEQFKKLKESDNMSKIVERALDAFFFGVVPCPTCNGMGLVQRYPTDTKGVK